MSMRRILSVSFDNLTGIARNAMLAHAGYAVSPATSTTRAFELLDKLRFDLVIVAASVPEAERRLLVLEIKRKFDVPVVMLNSAEPDPMIRARANIPAAASAAELLRAVGAIVPIKLPKKILPERRATPREPAGQ
jgi:hypothetical protein